MVPASPLGWQTRPSVGRPQMLVRAIVGALTKSLTFTANDASTCEATLSLSEAS